MSARNLKSPSLIELFPTPANRLQLSAQSFRVRKNGIEFKSATPLTLWSEMTVDLESPRDGRKIHCNGVIVACAGNRHSGFLVSMVFTNLSRQAQEKLNHLAVSRLE